MLVVVPKETAAGEKRVALVPDVVSKLTKANLQVIVESGAGLNATFTDEQYKNAGASVSANIDSDLTKADVVLSVQTLPVGTIAKLKRGAITISFLSVNSAPDAIASFEKSAVTALSLELVPRISRAQSMDALTSQALCAGYKAALVAAELAPKFFPLLMTAAGTITPANVVVLGAGVAGLQAIATAKRLGAVVSAYDVRPASADEVKSMGAKFISLELEALEGSGGYAREMSEDRALRQQELLTPYISAADVLITTAAVPGRSAPQLVTTKMVAQMKSGSVVVDLAAETGGNVQGSKAGETIITSNGVKIWGAKDVPSQLPFHASQLFARNVVNLLLLMSKTENGKPTGQLVPDFGDEIIAAATVTHEGKRR